MTDAEIRDALGAVLQGVRRALERERAAGAAELLLRSAAASERRRSAQALETPEASMPDLEPIPASAAASLEAEAPEPVEGRTALEPATRELTDLFGRPQPAVRETVAVAPAPPSVTIIPALHPIERGERERIVAESLPLLEAAAREICACTRCGLSGTRTRAVPGTGGASSGIVFVGEAPGAEEDRQGLPFVGRAGELLTKMIRAMDEARLVPGVPLDRETVYICNVLKCRPPENRNPLPHEVEACSPYLIRQLEALRPRMICCLGKFAAELLLGVKGTIAGLRGRVYRWRESKMIVTYHPAACLRNPSLKRPVWEDLQLLAREYSTD